MSKFSPGDPVWVRSIGYVNPPGEYPGTILLSRFLCYADEYRVEIPTTGPNNRGWIVEEAYLRSRRDDYQQHEGLGSMNRIIKAPDLTEASVEELCKNILAGEKS